MSDRLSSGRPASSLDAANNDTGRVAFCGPYVLSAITGFGISKIEDVIREGRELPPHRRPVVKGTYADEVESALAHFGYRMVLKETHLHRARKERPTLWTWMQKPRNAWAYYILAIHKGKEGHWILVKGVKMCDTFTEGEAVTFTGIPNFAPELFRRARLRDPLKLKQLQKGLAQLSEEGATQFFRPLTSNDLILGAVGVLQFDVAAYRLKDEYGVEATFEPVSVTTARWVHCSNEKKLEEFREKNALNLALDAAGHLVYLAPTRVNLQLAQERSPDVRFSATREAAHTVSVG